MKKILIFTTIILGITSVSAVAQEVRTNDNISFSFTVPKNQGNGYTPHRYRQTTNIHNQWKVNLAYSGEGVNTASRFWLELDNGANVSDSHVVTQGTGNHYYDAKSTASEKNVHLTAENNNYSGNSYKVSGYWDEEIQ